MMEMRQWYDFNIRCAYKVRYASGKLLMTQLSKNKGGKNGMVRGPIAFARQLAMRQYCEYKVRIVVWQIDLNCEGPPRVGLEVRIARIYPELTMWQYCENVML